MSVKQMMTTAKANGCAGASRSTVHKIFSEPREVLEQRAHDDWDLLLPASREFAALNPHSTIGLKTLAKDGKTIVRIIRSNEFGAVHQESPTNYNPYPVEEPDSAQWDAPQFQNLFLRML